jgi:hypothetical protein
MMPAMVALFSASAGPNRRPEAEATNRRCGVPPALRYQT